MRKSASSLSLTSHLLPVAKGSPGRTVHSKKHVKIWLVWVTPSFYLSIGRRSWRFRGLRAQDLSPRRSCLIEQTSSRTCKQLLRHTRTAIRVYRYCKQLFVSIANLFLPATLKLLLNFFVVYSMSWKGSLDLRKKTRSLFTNSLLGKSENCTEDNLAFHLIIIIGGSHACTSNTRWYTKRFSS